MYIFPNRNNGWQVCVQDGELFFYVTRRISGTQMIAHDFYEVKCLRQNRERQTAQKQNCHRGGRAHTHPAMDKFRTKIATY
ncbi:hypothetical protein D5282_23910 [bacterium 1xD8-48]|nr:hypothetical protein [bacterium 1xD8-48]